jgi:hypothetical protein
MAEASAPLRQIPAAPIPGAHAEAAQLIDRYLAAASPAAR